MHYTPELSHNYLEDYLTFEALENGSLSFRYHKDVTTTNARYVEYSTNGGNTWTRINNVNNQIVTTTINVTAGDIIMWRGDNTSLVGEVYPNDDEEAGLSEMTASYFTSTSTFDVYGNIMSILYPTNFSSQISLNNVEYAFAGFFGSQFGDHVCKLVDASNLKLPATILSPRCYEFMFGRCTTLTKAPELPALSLANSCYSYMYRYCSNLNEITCLAINMGNYSTSGWVSNVAATGTFIKHPAMSSWTTGDSGIPTGWTQQNAPITMISFVVRAVHGSENVTYQAEEGMTWREWVNTPYNTDGWEVYTYTSTYDGTTTDYIIIPNSISIYAGSGLNTYTVTPEDTIIDNYSYGTAVAPGIIIDE